MKEKKGECLAAIHANDVVWTFTPSIGPDAGVAREEFEDGLALAVLLAHEVVFLNTHFNREDWPAEARRATALYVNCSDVFAWACAEAEPITIDEIEDLYRFWLSDREWGAAAWCVTKRGRMPQAPVADAMRRAGHDLEALVSRNRTPSVETKATPEEDTA